LKDFCFLRRKKTAFLPFSDVGKALFYKGFMGFWHFSGKKGLFLRVFEALCKKSVKKPYF